MLGVVSAASTASEAPLENAAMGGAYGVRLLDMARRHPQL